MEKLIAKNTAYAATNFASGKGRLAVASVKIKHYQLMKLFEDQLKDIYWAEKALIKFIPKMIKKATNLKLSTALKALLQQTNEQLSRLERVFAIIEQEVVEKKCQAIDGLISEVAELMVICQKGVMRDAGILTASQKVAHYEIASYNALHHFAMKLGLTDASSLLAEIRSKEKATDSKFSKMAFSIINLEVEEIQYD